MLKSCIIMSDFDKMKQYEVTFFPELIIMDLGIINIHIVWRPMTLPKRESLENWKDMVTNEHLTMCVKACLIDIGFAKSQKGMETRQCKYCLPISLQFRRIRA